MLLVRPDGGERGVRPLVQRRPHGCGRGVRHRRERCHAGPLSYDLFDLWVNSAPHYANMVNRSYTHAGIGYVTAANGTRYGTMVLVIRC